MSYEVRLSGAARRALERLPSHVRERVEEAVARLAEAPRPVAPQGKPLTGPRKGQWRLRVGPWRVIYRPDDESQTVHVDEIVPRSRGYD